MADPVRARLSDHEGQTLTQIVLAELYGMTSCLAEYVDREIARQHNTVPPDELDDHGG